MDFKTLMEIREAAARMQHLPPHARGGAVMQELGLPSYYRDLVEDEVDSDTPLFI